KEGNIDSEVFWKKDWKAFPVEYSCQPLTTVEGELSGAVVAFRDIGERRQINAEIQGARDLALQSTQLKSEFLANMSHEIRTPMNAILGLAGLLEETPLDDQQRDFARTILNSADSLLALINDILDFSKGEAGKLTFESLDFELPSAVEGVVDLVSASARNKHLKLLCTVESNVPRFVRGDAGRLRQVLTNLLSNAVKFTSEGTVSLRVEMSGQTVAGDNAGTCLRFSVQDTGLGIDEETQKKLFKPFTQADGSTTRRFGGTGLGLAICKQIVEQMGAPDPGAKAPEIQIESRVGVGSTFRFEVYFAQALCEEKPRLKGKSVLLVDESEVNIKALRNLLELTNATILTANSGLQALLLRPPYPFDLAILRLEMAQMNSMRLAEALIDANSKIKIILLTAREPSESRACPFPIVREPYPPRVLFQQISQLLPMPPPVIAMPVSAIPITSPEVKSEPLPSRSLRILLAEDNVTNQKVALHQLHRLGHNAYAVNNGIEVLEITERIQYDVILMDCQMPEMDGYEATRQLRVREISQRVANGPNPHMWIIALTAHSLTGDREKCLAAGMDDYLSKPARLEAIQEALSRSQSVHSNSVVVASEQPKEPEAAVLPAKQALGQIRLESLQELEELSADFVQVMTASFQNEVPPCLEEIRRLSEGSILTAADGAAIARAAHKIKGSGANFGAQELGKICAQLESISRAEKLEEVRLLVPELEAEYDAVIVSLNKYIKERASVAL
ncbi:MAG: barA 6, partial [Chthoniobacteraceae bacterium]|nr:barA 6 [Chthoniobacteraceae bacterium]